MIDWREHYDANSVAVVCNTNEIYICFRGNLSISAAYNIHSNKIWCHKTQSTVTSSITHSIIVAKVEHQTDMLYRWLMHWSYCSLALSHQYIFKSLVFWCISQIAFCLLLPYSINIGLWLAFSKLHVLPWVHAVCCCGQKVLPLQEVPDRHEFTNFVLLLADIFSTSSHGIFSQNRLWKLPGIKPLYNAFAITIHVPA